MGSPVHRPFSILLVEDNPADAQLIREALEEHGVSGEMLLIRDGDRALRFARGLGALQEACPDLMIIDLNLPKRSGQEVLGALVQNHSCRKALMVILSSSDAEQDKASSLGLGATMYLKKPLHLDDFLGLGAIFRRLLEDERR